MSSRKTTRNGDIVRGSGQMDETSVYPYLITGKLWWEISISPVSKAVKDPSIYCIKSKERSSTGTFTYSLPVISLGTGSNPIFPKFCRTQSNSETNISLKHYNQARTTVIMILLKGMWAILYLPGRKLRRDFTVPQLPELKKITNYTKALLCLTPQLSARPVIITQLETQHRNTCVLLLCECTWKKKVLQTHLSAIFIAYLSYPF